MNSKRAAGNKAVQRIRKRRGSLISALDYAEPTFTARDATFDIAKGIGIILVVIGHSRIVLTEWHEIFRVIFSFHMPLFFFLSGIFIRQFDTVRQIITLKANRLLKPYLSATLIFSVGIVAAGATGTGPGKYLPGVISGKYLAGVIYGTGRTLSSVGGFPLVPLWFLPHLFIALLICLLILKAFTKADALRRAPVLTIICFTALSLAAWAIISFYGALLLPPIVSRVLSLGTSYLSQDLPFSLDLIPVTVGFILAGAIGSKKIRVTPFNLYAFLAAGASFAGLHYFYNETIDFNARHYGDFLICTAQAFLGIYITLSLSRLLSKTGISTKYLTYLGQSSLFIMIFHVAFMTTIRDLLPSGTDKLYLFFLTIPAGLFGPLILLEIVRRYRPLSLAFLSSKSNPSLRQAANSNR